MAALALLALDRGPVWYYDARRHHGANQVTVYSTSWCPVFARLRVCLREHGVPFEERDVERQIEHAAAVIESTHRMTRAVSPDRPKQLRKRKSPATHSRRMGTGTAVRAWKACRSTADTTCWSRLGATPPLGCASAIDFMRAWISRATAASVAPGAFAAYAGTITFLQRARDWYV